MEHQPLRFGAPNELLNPALLPASRGDRDPVPPPNPTRSGVASASEVEVVRVVVPRVQDLARTAHVDALPPPARAHANAVSAGTHDVPRIDTDTDTDPPPDVDPDSDARSFDFFGSDDSVEFPDSWLQPAFRRNRDATEGVRSDGSDSADAGAPSDADGVLKAGAGSESHPENERSLAGPMSTTKRLSTLELLQALARILGP
ncbi:hypothetical protein GGX14DRAFT_387992 [Mycena pura]|uniref:Uncharacterized protein n=1 Tax=Mycena pura TaxID=153505 RepID=A0AAD6VU10_9AGAR|nr:hypothetical protein GGX14DRAFT_387992 [Mycena pura]